MFKEKPKKDNEAEKYAALEKKINDPKYSNQIYPADKEVTIPAILFAEIMQNQHANQLFLTDLKANLERFTKGMSKFIDDKLTLGDIHSMNLTAKHIDFVDQGITETLKENDNRGTTEAENK